MRILVIGASGNIGKVVADTLEKRNHEVVRVSRSAEQSVDIGNPDSVRDLFARNGAIDAVIVAVGAVPLKHVTELTREDYRSGFESKVLGQIEVARQAFNYLRDGGSVTLTTGVSAREPIAGAAAAGVVNSALEGFTLTAAAEAPRGIRVNAVSPNILENSPHYEKFFVGQPPVSDTEVGRAYTLAVEGVINGRILEI